MSTTTPNTPLNPKHSSHYRQLRHRTVVLADVLVDQVAVEHAPDANWHLERRQPFDAVGLVGQVAQIEALQDALRQLLAQLATVVFI